MQAAVRPLIHVRGIPVRRGVLLRPGGHVIGLGVDRLVTFRLVVLPAAGNVVEYTSRAGASATRARAKRKVKATAAAAGVAAGRDIRFPIDEPFHRAPPDSGLSLS